MIEKLIMCTRIQNFDSVASHLELAILSRKFRTTEHAQWSAVEYFNFFSMEINLNLQDLYFHQVMGIMLQKQVIYWDFSIFRITTLDPCTRRHEEARSGQNHLINFLPCIFNFISFVFNSTIEKINFMTCISNFLIRPINFMLHAFN